MRRREPSARWRRRWAGPTAFDFASIASGTSLSTFTASVGNNPNPRCTSTDLVPLTTNINDYRDAGLSFRGTDRKLYNAIWFWEN